MDDKSLVKAVEELASALAILAVTVGSTGYMSEKDAKSFNSHFGKYERAIADVRRAPKEVAVDVRCEVSDDARVPRP